MSKLRRSVLLTSISIILIICTLSSCTGRTVPPTDVPGTSGAVTTALPEPAGELEVPVPGEKIEVRIGDSSTAYKLVRPDKDNTARTKILIDLNNYFKEIAGFSLTPMTDWHRAGDALPEYEILLGNADRDETRDAMSRIGYDGFSVTKYGEKIVIAAHKREKLLEAVEYFKSGLSVTEENGKKVLWYKGENHTEDSDTALNYFFGTEAPLESYRIVCDRSDKKIAGACSDLQREIKSAFGVNVEIKDSISPAVDLEIIVGDCARPEARTSLSGLSGIEYTIRVCGDNSTKIFIGGLTPETTAVAVKRFISKFVNSLYSNSIIMENNYSELELAYSYQDSNVLAEGADIRIMSFNLLTELWDLKLPIAGRDVIANDLIRYYSPDVVGLQEVSDGWHATLAKLFGSDYKITDTRNGQGRTNFSTLAYNTAKTKMLDHGVTVFSKGNDTRLRLATWGYFEQISSGKKYIVVSTHWDLGKNAEYQMIHSNEMAELVLDLGKRFGCPVITTGDYNSNENSDPYINYVMKTGYLDAKHNCDKVNRYSTGTHSVGSSPNIGEGLLCIDHIFGSTSVKFLYFNVLVDSFVNEASDHNPIYADIKLTD